MYHSIKLTYPLKNCTWKTTSFEWANVGFKGGHTSYHQNRPRPVTWRVPTNSPLVQGLAYPFPGHGHSDHRNPGPMCRDHPIGPLQQYGPVKLEAGEILSKCQRLIHHSYGPTFTSHKEGNKNSKKLSHHPPSSILATCCSYNT